MTQRLLQKFKITSHLWLEMILDQLLERGKKYRRHFCFLQNILNLLLIHLWQTQRAEKMNRRAISPNATHNKSNAMPATETIQSKQTQVSQTFFPLIVSWPWQTASWHKRPMLIIYNPIANDEHDRHSNGISLSLVLCMAEMVESGDRKHIYQMLE